MSAIIGYGGGKSGESSSTSREASDSLRSISYAKVLDLVSEGEIQGLANGLRSVYFDKTPLQNADGSFNFNDVTVDVRTGTPHQEVIAGFPGVENEITISTELRSDASWVHAINNTQLSAVRVRLAVTALSRADATDGSINGHRVAYLIELATNGGAYKEVMNQAFEGKTTSRYERSHRLELPLAKKGWMLRVTRTTPNANSATTADVTLVSTVTEVIDVKLRYPMSAIVGIQIDASQFQGIPIRSYDMLGRIINVPGNYNPANRSYEGVWDGTFKPAWTDNPAWVFYDLILNDRYGLGHRLDGSSIDKWSLYQIGRYCDVLVPDGQGGTEPRFTCNCYLQAAADAYKVLQDLASIFRGISYWAGGSIITSADMPSDPTYIYTAANVIDGKFTGVGSSQKARFTVALVSWNDPNDFYKAKVEYVQDDDGIARYGVQKISMTAFGCTSQGQAQRAGNWALLTSRLETDSLTFSVGLDGLVSSPGQLVRIADPHRMGRRNAGRIRLATGRTVTLDKAPVIEVGDKLTVILPTAVSETHTVIAIKRDTVTVNGDWSVMPAPQAIWSVDNMDLVAPIYKIISITEQGGLTYEITALQHEQGKFAYIDGGTRIEKPPHTGLEASPGTPTNLLFSTHPYWVDDVVSATNATLSWSGFSPVYRVKWRKVFSAWQETKTRTSTLNMNSVEAGHYEFAVSAISSTGLESAAATLNTKVTPTLPPLEDITGLRLESSFTSNVAKVAWDKVKGATSYRVQVVAGNPALIVRTINVGNTPRFEYTVTDMKADGGTWRTVEFRVKALGKFGTGSAVASLMAENKQIGALVAMRVDQGIRSGYFQCKPPPEDDFAGILIWISTEETCPPSPENLIYDGTSCFVTLTHYIDGSELSKEVDYYLRAAAYDQFGQDDLTVSTAIPLNVAGVLPDAKSIASSMLTQELSERIDQIGDFDPTGVVAKIVEEREARTEADSAIAQTVTTLQTTLNGNIASVKTQAKSISGLSAQYTVKTDVNGHVAGYGLATTVINGVPKSDFTILADRFAVVQNGVEKRVPFVVTSKNNVAQIGIDGSLLVNGSVTADALLANSITADKIKAGSFSADIFTTGIGSGNLCPNAALIDFYTDAQGRTQPTGMIVIDTIGEVKTGINYSGDTLRPVEINCYVQHTPNDLYAGSDYWKQYVDSVLPHMPVVAGQWYEFSAYNGSHRCSSIMLVYYYNAAGELFASAPSANDNAAEMFGGVSLTGYKRLFGFSAAPEGAVTARLVFRKSPTHTGHADSVAFWVRPYFGTATGAHQLTPSDWSPPGMGTQINGGAITTRSIAADKIAVNQLSAITADLGYVNAGAININNRFIVGADGTTTIQSAPWGQRTVMSNGQTLVYDANNVLRVRLGVW